MAVYRVDIFIADPTPVRRWIDENVPSANVVRTKVLTKPFGGSFLAAVFTEKENADAFRRHWCAKSADDWASLPDKFTAWAECQEAAAKSDEAKDKS